MTLERAFIGVDPTAGKGLLTYAVLDQDLDVRAIASTDLEGVLEAVTVYPAALCAIDGPSGKNLGLMADPAYRERLGLRPNTSRYAGFRVGEYELRRRNISLYRTPSDPEAAPSWMRLSWELYAALEQAGYVRYPRDGPRQVFEVSPRACFTVLLGRRPRRRTTLEGRLQRQLLLYEEGLSVADPMHVFQELTRHHVLAGRMAMDDLHGRDQLDALAAAYTAYLLVEEPEHTSSVGDPAEGIIVVPTSSLKTRYP